MDISDFGLVISLFVLIILSAFFSASETALMTVNRYKILHKARLGNKFAKLDFIFK